MTVEVQASGDLSRFNQIDSLIGARLREKRISRGLTQEQLAERLQVAVDDIHLYERGMKRVGAEVLMRAATTLHIKPVDLFRYSDYDGLGVQSGRPKDKSDESADLAAQGRRLHRAFVQIRDAAVREALVDLAVSMTGGHAEQ